LRPPDIAFETIGTTALALQTAPGFSFAVARDGEVAFENGYGFADVERWSLVEERTRFAIGSITKQFTAVAILLLAQQGGLSLDDRLAKYLPEFPNGSAITIRMLINQTSGLHNYPLLSEHPWPLSGRISLDSLLRILATDKPDFAPGTKWAYSNTNYAVLSAIIARVAETDEASFLQANIFGPLKMTESGFGYAAQQRPEVALPYHGHGSFRPQEPIVSLDLTAGAGAMVSSATDLTVWNIALMQGALLDTESMQALWTSGKLRDGKSVAYAMGFVPATLAGHRVLWHNGLAPGAGGYCLNAIFPDAKLAVVVLSNGYNFSGAAEQIVAHVLAAYYPKRD